VLADQPPQDPVALLRRESRSLAQRLRLWTPARFAAAAPPFGSRGDLVHHLAQDLADAAAAAEGQPLRLLPRLDDLALPDQLAVTADDLVRAAPSARVARAATAHLLAHRHDLLDEDVPAGLAAALGMGDAVASGRTICDVSGQSTL
jgi:hypothetical protein